jgi:tripartite-type tricarboxylate transporter receptor subunit TctC
MNASSFFVTRGSRFALAALCVFPASIAMAQVRAYPDKSIRLVVASAPAGTPDILARIFAQRISDSIKQPVLVDNRAGAGGIIGTDAVAKAPADGYTVLFAHLGTFAVNPALYPKLPYDVLKDFQAVSLIATVPNMLVVNAAVPAHSVKDLIALAKARPGELNYSSAGNGSIAHLAVEYFKLLAKVEVQHVPYKGTAPGLTGIIAGEAAFTITGLPAVMPLVKSGKLRALGVSTAQALRQFPDIPAIAESGVPGYEVTQWYGLAAPAATPANIVARLNSETAKALQNAELRVRFETEAADPISSTPEQFRKFIESEITKWAPVVKASGAKPD